MIENSLHRGLVDSWAPIGISLVNSMSGSGCFGRMDMVNVVGFGVQNMIICPHNHGRRLYKMYINESAVQEHHNCQISCWERDTSFVYSFYFHLPPIPSHLQSGFPEPVHQTMQSTVRTAHRINLEFDRVHLR